MRITLYTLFSLSILTTLFLSCSPLRQIQKTEQKQEQIVDKSIEELVSVEIERQIASLRQTRVEFYPPNIVYSIDTLSTPPTLKSEISPQNSEKPKDSVQCRTLSTLKTLPIQGVKSITTTEIVTKADKIAQKDSITHKDIVHTINTDYTEKIAEKPPAGVVWIKWVVVTLVVILIIIILLKI